MKHLKSDNHLGGLRSAGRRRFHGARLAFFVVLVLAATAGLTTASQACGFGMHNEIAERAVNLLDPQAFPELVAWLNAYPGFRDGGSVFPDWAMAADHDLDGNFDLYGEWAHRQSFWAAYADVIKPLLKKTTPLTEDDKKAITFLFGIIAHVESDNPSHFGSGGVEGFFPMAIQEDGAVALSRIICSTALGSNPHPCTEFGVDIIVIDHYGEFWSDEWWFPIGYIQAAYGALGANVTTNELEVGLSNQKLAFDLEKTTSVVDKYDDMDWVHNNLEWYAVGGLQDAAFHTAETWRNAWYRLNAPTFKVYLPSITRGPSSSPDRWQKISNDTPSAADSGSYIAMLGALANTLRKEGVVRVDTRWENGNLVIGEVEIVDYRRYDEMTSQFFMEQDSQISR